MTEWSEMRDQRGPDGLQTPLALALDALEDHGCDCGEDEPGTCLACICERALHDLWSANDQLECSMIHRSETPIPVAGEARPMTDPNVEAMRIVRECLTPEARAALGHLLNNALQPVVMEADMLPWNDNCPLRHAVKHLREVVAEVLRDPSK